MGRRRGRAKRKKEETGRHQHREQQRWEECRVKEEEIKVKSPEEEKLEERK